MIQRVLSHYHLPVLACLGLILFMSVFVVALFWVFRSESDSVYRVLEQFPLQDLKSNTKGDR